jgi:hypothetical protein
VSHGSIHTSVVGPLSTLLASSYIEKRMLQTRMRVACRPMVRVLAFCESAATRFRVRALARNFW